MLADCLEAVIGAYVKSRGLLAAIKIMHKFRMIRMDGWTEYITDIYFAGHYLHPDLTAEDKIDKLLKSCAPGTSVENALGYHFNNPALLNAALTHETVDEVVNYERLEYLGDAVLDLVVMTMLVRFEDYKFENEFQISNLKHILVSNQTYSRYI